LEGDPSCMQITRNRKIIIATVVVIGLTAIVVLSGSLQRKEGQPVQTGRVERRARIESKVTASGDIRPVKYYDLTAEVSGRVEQIYVSEGDVVKKGQALVRVDPTQFSLQSQANEAAVRVSQAEVMNQRVAVESAQNQVRQAQASLAAAQAELERSRADLQFAENEYNRNLQLVESGIISKSVFDQAKSRYEQAKAVVRSQEARVKQLEQQVREAEYSVERARALLSSAEARVRQSQAQFNIQADLLRRTIKYSPIDGVVSYLPVKVGQFALANFQSTPLLTVADMSQINAEIKVDETDIADVAIGQKAKVKVDALGEVEIEGEVIEKGASAISRTTGQATTTSATSQEAKDFLVKIKLNPSPEIRDKLRPGMSATAVITTATADDVLAVPLQAVVPRELPKNEADKSEPSASGITRKREVEGVFVFGKDGRAHFTPVETGIKGDQEIQIKSGVNEGDEIVIGPYKTLRALKDGDLIKREPKPESTQSGSNQPK
jgi:HlyD family secretion protein